MAGDMGGWAGHAELVSVADALCAIVKSDPESSSHLSSSVQSLLRLTSNLIQDTNQVARLRVQVAAYLSADNRAWIDQKLSIANDTLRSVAVLLIPLYDDHHKSGSIHFRTRLKYMLDKEKVEANSKALSSTHLAITSAMPFLEAAESRKRFHEPETGSLYGDSQDSASSRSMSTTSSIGYRRPKLRASSQVSRASNVQPHFDITSSSSDPPSLHLRNSSFDPLFGSDMFRPGTAVSALTSISSASSKPTESSDAASVVSTLQHEPNPHDSADDILHVSGPTHERESDPRLNTSNDDMDNLQTTALVDETKGRNSFEILLEAKAKDSPALGSETPAVDQAQIERQSRDWQTSRRDSSWDQAQSLSRRQTIELSLHNIESPSDNAPEALANKMPPPPTPPASYPSLAQQREQSLAARRSSDLDSIPESLRVGSPVIKRKPVPWHSPPPPPLQDTDRTLSPWPERLESKDSILRPQQSTASLVSQLETDIPYKFPDGRRPVTTDPQSDEPVELPAETNLQTAQMAPIAISVPLRVRSMPISTSEERMMADTSKIAIIDDDDLPSQRPENWRKSYAEGSDETGTRIPVKRPKARGSTMGSLEAPRVHSYSCCDYSA